MLVLLDQCVPHPLRHYFPGHDVHTARFMGWDGLTNGALLAAMRAGGFQVLLTVDQNLRHQQNLTAAGVAVVVMLAPTNTMPDLTPLVPEVAAALLTIRPGDVVEVAAS